MRRFLVVIAVLIATLTTLSAAPADPDQLSGYTRDNAQAERQWEQKFKAITRSGAHSRRHAAAGGASASCWIALR